MEFQLLNKFEKEKRVIELHKEGKTLKEIAEVVHMSFRDISKITKVYDKKKLQQTKKREGNNQIKKPSLRSQAFKLFLEDKKPIDVAIELDISAKKVDELWSQFLKLKGMDDCYEFYQVCQYDLPALLSINNFIKRNSAHIKDIANILMEAKTTANLQLHLSILKNDIERLQKTKNNYLLNQNNNYQQIPPMQPLPRYPSSWNGYYYY